MNRGATKNTAVASAKGKLATPMKKHMFAAMNRRPLITWRPGRRVRSRRSPPSSCTITSVTTMAVTDRAKVISWERERGAQPLDHGILEGQRHDAAEDAEDPDPDLTGRRRCGSRCSWQLAAPVTHGSPVARPPYHGRRRGVPTSAPAVYTSGQAIANAAAASSLRGHCASVRPAPACPLPAAGTRVPFRPISHG